jgi:hypothetical protein
LVDFPGKPFVAGQSGNPLGRSKAALDVQALARQHTAEAIETLVGALRDPKLKVQAAEALLGEAAAAGGGAGSRRS